MKKELYEHMTDSEMEELLFAWGETPMFSAYMRYVDQRDIQAITGILGLDPFKQPTAIAQSQGVHLGLRDVPNYLEALQEKRAGSKPEGEEAAE